MKPLLISSDFSTFQIAILLAVAIFILVCCAITLGVFLTLRRDRKRFEDLAGHPAGEPTHQNPDDCIPAIKGASTHDSGNSFRRSPFGEERRENRPSR